MFVDVARFEIWHDAEINDNKNLLPLIKSEIERFILLIECNLGGYQNLSYSEGSPDRAAADCDVKDDESVRVCGDLLPQGRHFLAGWLYLSNIYAACESSPDYK